MLIFVRQLFLLSFWTLLDANTKRSFVEYLLLHKMDVISFFPCPLFFLGFFVANCFPAGLIDLQPLLLDRWPSGTGVGVEKSFPITIRVIFFCSYSSACTRFHSVCLFELFQEANEQNDSVLELFKNHEIVWIK